MSETRLRVLIKRGKARNQWVAICIDRYMVAEGDSPEDAARALHREYQRETARHPDLGHLPQAPAAYLSDFENASPELAEGDAASFDQRRHEPA